MPAQELLAGQHGRPGDLVNVEPRLWTIADLCVSCAGRDGAPVSAPPMLFPPALIERRARGPRWRLTSGARQPGAETGAGWPPSIFAGGLGTSSGSAYTPAATAHRATDSRQTGSVSAGHEVIAVSGTRRGFAILLRLVFAPQTRTAS